MIIRKAVKVARNNPKFPATYIYIFFFSSSIKNLLWFLFVFHLSGSWGEMKRAQVRPAGRGPAVARVVLILWIRWCLWQIQTFSYLLTSVGPTAATPSVRPQIHSDPLWSTQQRISDTRPSAGYRNRPSLSKYKPLQSASVKMINNHQVMWIGATFSQWYLRNTEPVSIATGSQRSLMGWWKLMLFFKTSTLTVSEKLSCFISCVRQLLLANLTQ